MSCADTHWNEENAVKMIEKVLNVYDHFQVVSCFRSSGSMPIPKTAALPSTTFLAPPPRPRDPTPPPPLPAPKTHQAKELDLTIQESRADPLPKDASQQAATAQAEVTVTGREIVHQATVGSPVTVVECPPPPKPKKKQSCKKHSRCHCDLLSMKVDDFFDVVPQ